MASENENRGGHRECLEDFIDIYRMEPCLWRIKSQCYHDRNMKDAAYEKLIEKYKKIDPDAKRDVVVKKINNLRSTYRKELKKVNDSKKSGIGEDEVYIPKLWYFHLMDFLRDQETPRTSVSNLSGNENEDELADLKSTQHAEGCNQPNSAPLSPPSLQDSGTSIEHTPARPSRSRPPKKSTASNLTEDVFNAVNNHFKKPRIEERFEVYGKNVGMKLRELVKDQRILAEKIINETLFLAEMGQLTMSHSVQNNNFINTNFSSHPWQPQIQSQPYTTDDSAGSFISNYSDV